MQPIPYFGERIRGAWVYEPKFDGWRMQVVCNGARQLECWGRRLERRPNWSEKLHYLLKGLKSVIPANTLLDCELCSDGGRRFIPSLFARTPKVEPIVYVFDIIYLAGKDISDMPLIKRKEELGKIHFTAPFVCIRGRKLTNLQQNYDSEVSEGYEGIVIKKLSSPYLVGKEAPIATQDWRKIK